MKEQQPASWRVPCGCTEGSVWLHQEVIVTKNGVSTKPSIYPVTIARARYHGDYEGASWVCFPLTVQRLTEEPWSRWDDADERECRGFWNGARAQELLIGLGDSPTAAYDNLIELACARVGVSHVARAEEPA